MTQTRASAWMNKLAGAPLAQLLALLLAGLATVGAPWPAAAETGFANHEPNDPIRFTADRLEVRREGRVATFIGNVEAVQGDMYLNADVIKVYYQSSSESQTTTDTGGFGGSVSRIDTSGNVKIESRGDKASGDWAVYDVGRKIVTMGGQVVLERDETMLTGNRLELDLENGRSSIHSASTGSEDTRVRGEFTPANSDTTTGNE